MKNKLRNSKKIISMYLYTLLCLLLLSGCSQSETITETNYMQITAKEAKNIMDNETDYIILDVRTEEEFSEGHIDGAILIPDYEIADKAEEILSLKRES